MLAAFSGTTSSGVASTSASLTPAGYDDDQGFDVRRDLLEHLSLQRFAALDAVLAPDCLLLLPGIRPVTGAALVGRVLRGIRGRYEALHFETLLQFRSDDGMVVANSKVRGTRHDGTPYLNEAVTLIRLDRLNRVALISDYNKDTAFAGHTAKRPHPRHA